MRLRVNPPSRVVYTNGLTYGLTTTSSAPWLMYWNLCAVLQGLGIGSFIGSFVGADSESKHSLWLSLVQCQPEVLGNFLVGAWLG